MTAGDDPAAVPVPVNDTLCGEPLALSVIVIASFLVPDDAGLKLIDKVQLAPAARLEPQPLVSTKSSASPPVNAIEVMLRLALPLFVSFTVWAAEVVPTV